MKPLLLFISLAFIFQLQAQNCGTGGCSAADTNSTGLYPAATFSTSSSTWQTVTQWMNGGNYTMFDVTSGETYEWTYCSDFGGSQSWNAELTLFDNGGNKLCYNDNCNRTGCPTAPYIRWTATYTGKVKLLTTVSGCAVNTGSPYAKLVWRDTSGTPLVQVLGVDVYSGQGVINWSQVKAAGYTFAWAKATEGVGYTDSQYLNYAVNGVNAGMKMGAYHFARLDLNPTTTGAVNEANYFLSVAQPYIISCQLMPSLDIEGSYIQSNFTPAQLTAWIQTWMNTVQNATGIKPVLYISPSNAAYVQSSLNTYPLWVDYVDGSSTVPPPNIGVWNYWSFKQYDWTASVPGIPGSSTDLNVFNGNMATFNTLMGCNTTGITQENVASFFSIYPNPASSSFQVSYPFTLGMANVTVYDVNGKIVLNETLSGPGTLDVQHLNAGVYSVNIHCDNLVLNKKLVIAR